MTHAIDPATLSALRSALNAAQNEIIAMRSTLEWIANPSTGLSHVIFRQEATLRAERSLAALNVVTPSKET
jgi:hypothetical protein